MVFSSGMSAAIAVFLSLSPGDHVIAPKTMLLGAALLAADRRRALGAGDELCRAF